MSDDEYYDDNDCVYSISNMNKFCESVRLFVANDLRGLNSNDDVDKPINLDEFVTIKQIENIVLHNSLPNSEDNRVLINVEAYDNICDQILQIIYGAALAKLAADGFLESAWDDQLNDMVFWIKDSK